MMVPAEEFDVQKACLFRFFSQIEDDMTHRIAHVLGANWKAIHLLTEEQTFSARVTTYKRALSSNPDSSFDVERDRDFWRILDDLRIMRNAFAHGSQFFVQDETGIRHIYSRAGPALNGKAEQGIDLGAMPFAVAMATHLHLLMQCVVIEDLGGQTAMLRKVKSDWEQAKPFLPKGRSPKWPPRPSPDLQDEIATT